MRRPLLIIVAAGLLAIAAAWVSFGFASRALLEEVRVATEEALSDALEGPVRIRSARLSVSWGLLARGFRLEADGVTAWPGPDGPALEVRRAEAPVSIWALLSGQVRPRRVMLEGVRLRIERLPDGRWQPVPLERLLLADAPNESGPQAGDEDVFEHLKARVQQALRRWRRLRQIEIRDGSVVLVDARQAPFPELVLQVSEAGLVPGTPRRAWSLRLAGRLRREATPAATLELAARREPGGRLELALGVQDLDLGLLAPRFATLDPRAVVSGRATGRIVLHERTRGWQLESQLQLHGARLGLAGGPSAAPANLDLDGADLSLRVVVDPESLHLSEAYVRAPELELNLQGTLALPVQESSRLAAELDVPRVRAAQAREWLAHAPASWSWAPELARQLARVEGGSLRDVRLSAKANLAAWREGAARGSVPLVSASGVLHRLALRVGDGQRFDELHGNVRLRRDRIELEGVRGRLDGRPLPRLDLALGGVRHLLAARATTAWPDPPPAELPGLLTALELLASNGAPAGPTPRLELEADWLVHPALLFPVEGLRAVAQPENASERERWTVELEQATWGGVPVSGLVLWLGGPESGLVATFEARAPQRDAPPREIDADTWARARWALTTPGQTRYGVASSRGLLRAHAGRIELSDLRLDLRDAGALTGQATLQLTRADEIPLDAELALEDAGIGTVLSTLLHFEPEEASGRVGGSVLLTGGLRPGVPNKKTLSGRLDLHARDGHLGGPLPIAMAVADASGLLGTLENVRDGFRFERIDAEFALEDGVLQSDRLSIDGPDVRMVASGVIDMVDPAHELDAVVGLLMFRSLDWAIGKLPVVNSLLLGSDDNLFGAYIHLNGPWRSPAARLIPTRSLLEGPANVFVAGVPGLVSRVVGGMRWMLLGTDTPSEEAPVPAPPLEP